MSQYTKWFDATVLTPYHPGEYKCRLARFHKVVIRMWDGERWMSDVDLRGVYSFPSTFGMYEGDMFCGLTEQHK